jgi:hypothetical protein
VLRKADILTCYRQKASAWTKNEIAARQKTLADLALKTWAAFLQPCTALGSNTLSLSQA